MKKIRREQRYNMIKCFLHTAHCVFFERIASCTRPVMQLEHALKYTIKSCTGSYSLQLLISS